MLCGVAQKEKLHLISINSGRKRNTIYEKAEVKNR